MYKSPIFWVFAFFILGFVLRVLFLPGLSLTFGYDQARDAFIAKEITGGDFKILGPSVSGVPGFYHGVLYYYVIAPAYALGQGNPTFVSYFLSLVNTLVVFVVYFLTKKMFRKTLPAVFAALLFAVSFEQAQYATWLSNPAMGVWFVTVIYLGLYLWLKQRKRKFLALTGLAFGLSIQSNVSLAYHIIPIVLFLWYSRRDLGRKQLLVLILPFLLAVFTMLLVEIRFGFRSLEGIKHLLTSQQISGPKIRLGGYLVNFLDHMGGVFAHNLFPFISALGGITGLGIVFKYLLKMKDKNYKWSLEIKLLLAWVLSYLIAAAVSGTIMPHISAGIGVGLLILIALFIWETFQKSRVIGILLLAGIFLFNFTKILLENDRGQTIFAIQADMTLANELAAINYTYTQSEGKPFSINTLTSPLWINTTWSYLYNWYGKQKYGYLPEWHGRDQVGQLGNNLGETSSATQNYFFIIEPQDGIPPQYLGWETSAEDTKSMLVEEVSFGAIKVQKRQAKKALAKE